MYERIPQEMRKYHQYVVWRYADRDGKKTKVPYDPETGYPASVDDPRTWADFDTAVAVARDGRFNGLGFVLTERDPFCFIDLDGTKDPEVLKRQIGIYQSFDSYTERSPSGTGAHIICQAHVPRGRRRSSVEIYSSARYMTMTGDVVLDRPIAERQELANILWGEMGKDNQGNLIVMDAPQTEEDSIIINKGMKARNDAKFTDLYQGNWQKHYPHIAAAGQGPSEADFALIDMIAFYTQNRDQIRRIFLASGLGQRDKARKRPKYLSDMIDRSFDRMLPPIDFDAFRQGVQKIIDARKLAESGSQSKQSVYTFPPGLMGEIVDFIYRSATRQVPEVALAGAIGLMSGMCGRAFNTQTGTGLSMYTLLLAQTGIGKDGMYAGIDRLVDAVATLGPSGSNLHAAPSI